MKHILSWLKTLSADDKAAIFIPLVTFVVTVVLVFAGMLAAGPTDSVRVKGKTVTRGEKNGHQERDTARTDTVRKKSRVDGADTARESGAQSAEEEASVTDGGTAERASRKKSVKASEPAKTDGKGGLSGRARQNPAQGAVSPKSAAPDGAQSEPSDTTPPELTVLLSPGVLWPPNHQMVDTQATVAANDENGPVSLVRLVSITSNEAGNDAGDGFTEDDFDGAEFGTHDLSFRLRAERRGGGTGRIYTITYSATDAHGNTTTVSGNVLVPHDMQGDNVYLPQGTGKNSF